MLGEHLVERLAVQHVEERSTARSPLRTVSSCGW